VRVTYVGFANEVELEVPRGSAVETVVVRRGESVELPDGYAGRVPSETDPGDGLLAQVDAWQRADGSSSRRTRKRQAETEPEPGETPDVE
jgi:hypothetical protein